VALIENRVASGAVGCAEGERLAELFAAAAGDKTSLVLFIDSAGAKVSEGLNALGAFRTLYRAGLDAVLAGVPLAIVLGRNCYGGASMLAHLASQRMFSPGTPSSRCQARRFSPRLPE
jgi:acetyl-CoA carboxylase beta subunit